MILHIPELLSTQELKSIEPLLAAARWVDGKMTAGTQSSLVKQNMQIEEEDVNLYAIREIINAALKRHPLFVSAALPLHTISPFVNRYENGGFYGNHVDNAILFDRLKGQSYRTDISSTLFLTSPESYEGGEMVIEDTYGMHEVKLPAGDMILYPSTSLHRVESVTSGVRIASFMWTQSMVRDAGKRAMLFELDQTIQQLRLEYGESEQALALSIHYHKLLQLWAEL